MSQEIQLYQTAVTTMEHIETFGRLLAKSGMYGCENEQQGQVVAMTCVTERMSPLQFRNTYHLIQGNPTMKAHAMLAKFRVAGGKHKIIARTPDLSEAEFTAPGDSEPVKFTVKWDEIKTEPFVFDKGGKVFKKNWATPRARTQTMWARLISEAVNALCPEVSSGLFATEAEESNPTQGSSLNLDPSKPSDQKKDATVIDVSAEVVSEQPAKASETSPAAPKADPATAAPAAEKKTAETPHTTPEPVKETAKAPAIFIAKPSPTAKDPKNPTIDGDTVIALADSIPVDKQPAALKALAILGWLKDGQLLGDLSVNHAQRIFRNVPGFLNCKAMKEAELPI